jgi:hypothetical protein
VNDVVVIDDVVVNVDQGLGGRNDDRRRWGAGIAVAIDSDLRTRDWDRGGRPMGMSTIQFRRRRLCRRYYL